MLSCLCRTWHEVLCQPRWWRSHTVFEESHLARNLTGAEVCHRHREGSFNPGISVYRKLQRLGLLAPPKTQQKQRLRPFRPRQVFTGRAGEPGLSGSDTRGGSWLCTAGRQISEGGSFRIRIVSSGSTPGPSIERQSRLRISRKPGASQVTKIVRGTPRLPGHPRRMLSSARRRQPWTARRFAVLDQF